jgi:spermidine/putrescine ABC transporter ATP-binding subunit
MGVPAQNSTPDKNLPIRNGEETMKKLIQFKNIVKEFDGNLVLKGINLDIYENEFVTLLGPSGCGKTTLLRILGGFLTPDKGQVMFDGADICELPPYKREINTVFQKYALFPHMNVYDNVAFGLKIKKEPKDVIEQKVKRMLKLVGLEDFGPRRINEMSGGQQQRVAIARALVNEPSVLLLDEPLGALDLKLRKEMQHELKKIQQEVGITFVFVTHDQEEALTMSDKIVVMKEGTIQQIGSPTDIYNEPANEFVARFIGESNIIDGVMIQDKEVMFEDKKFACLDAGFAPNEKVDVVIRPEDLDIVPKEQGKLKGVVKSVLFKGVHYETIVETRSGTSITVTMHVSEDKPVVNTEAKEKMSANDFYLDLEDIAELTEADIIARADAQAWDSESEDWISINKVEYDIEPKIGTYPVTFSTKAGTMVSAQMFVREANRIASKEYEEEIYAVNFFKKVDEIKESMALDTDLKTWANASAWSLEDGVMVEITDVVYDFDPETIVPGDYKVTFKTEGYEYMIDTTDKHEVGEEVGLLFGPEDIHIMSRKGSY